ncbi:MAG: 2-C-methyl-D-erythritol 4-phosphate cytidylyltransferase [candidate division WOR-3 bacterium]|nr:MAG: 2-C-methyl-D-erythritol 4-phosphate cytidylyltransferase [candidate division WOR-3 bacterium]
MSSNRPARRKTGFGLIVAAGRGTRFGRLKQFARVRGRPLLFYSLRSFERCPSVTGYVVVTNPDRVRSVRRMLSRWEFGKAMSVVPGGRLRQDSVRNGLEPLPEQGWVAVHDAARPLVTPEMIARGIRACTRTTPVTYGMPITDTVKQVSGNRVVKTVDRGGLLTVQTPQFFAVNLLRRAHRQAAAGSVEATDDCSLVERLGIRPRVLPGPVTNIKVTFVADIRLVRRLL